MVLKIFIPAKSLATPYDSPDVLDRLPEGQEQCEQTSMTRLQARCTDGNGSRSWVSSGWANMALVGEDPRPRGRNEASVSSKAPKSTSMTLVHADQY